MNNNQIIDVKNRIEIFNQIKLNELLALIFQNQDIQNLRIGQYTVPEYSSILKRLFKQLTTEIKENGYYLPHQYNFQNEFGNGSLNNDIQNIINNVNAKNQNSLNNSIGFINRLVYYQVINGFWDKSVRKVHKYNEIKVSELNNELKLVNKGLSTNFEIVKKQVKEIEIEKNKLIEFINQKNQELLQIKNNVGNTNQSASQISQLLINSTSTNEKINSHLSQQNQLITNNKKKFETEVQNFDKQKTIFRSQEKKNDENIKIIEKGIKEFDKKLLFIEDKKEYFEERNNYLNELIGREVGVSLFETFKQRKGELEKPVNNWLWIVIGMAILSFVAILAIFTNMFGYLPSSNMTDTIQLITNSIKTLPFFFLLFYAISQYNKERNFQEEYAFKSSVALTIKAYSDIIEKSELKDDLIIKSVTNVYKSPTTYKVKNKKENDNILDTAKDLLTTALEVLKKK